MVQAGFTSDDFTLEGARALDADDSLPLREEFMIPTKAQIASSSLPGNEAQQPIDDELSEKCIYLCGNSLGLQPKRTATRIRQYLDTWATQGVQGHFKPLADSPLSTWLNVDQRAAEIIAPIVGAEKEEVAIMETLTANLHLLMSGFYQPERTGRYKIILERKAFPSDHFAIETQIRHHGLDPAECMVFIEDRFPSSSILSTDGIMKTITEHASTTALLVLPGIQYYSGQLLPIAITTSFAHAHGIFCLWDLAHAVGNVELKLHEWEVDAAVWCSYKYLNGGPGCIGGMFVHERHTRVDDGESVVGNSKEEEGKGKDTTQKDTGNTGEQKETRDCSLPKPHRLGGWWGNSKSSRFTMAVSEGFVPVPGAAGFQLSNPSVLDITSLCASLEVFDLAGGMEVVRAKSVRLTRYLEASLRRLNVLGFLIITPTDEGERGAQLSLHLLEYHWKGKGQSEKTMLDVVMEELGKRGVVVDERRPNVIRVSPAPLYNSFEDVYKFVEAFSEAMAVVR